MVKDSGYPGMKVLQFAFDSREASDYLPHNYEHNCVVYTGTHDNDTILGWYDGMADADREFSKEYMNNYKSTREELPWDFIRLAMGSVADLCIIRCRIIWDLAVRRGQLSVHTGGQLEMEDEERCFHR